MSASACDHSDRLADVKDAFRSLPERFLGVEPGFDATWRIVLGDVGHSWEVRCTEHGARVRTGATKRRPDVIIGTDADTWMALRRGALSGLDAFNKRLLYARGNLDLAVAFESLFRRENGRPPLLRMHDVHLSGRRVSTLTLGAGPDIILIHGLGGAKSSFFDIAPTLAERYRVHALDLPGFGSSSKPPLARYNARYFADTVRETMDALGIQRAHVAGNSMGGRVAVELALREPQRVTGLALLCPAVAFVKRSYHPLVRLLRPEFGLLPHRFTRKAVEQHVLSLFGDRDQLDPSVADLVVDEFQRIYSSAGARTAFLASARSIYLDQPYGRGGFYPRLAELEVPSLWMWGSHDTVIPPAFKRHVEQWLPGAEQIILDGCGHVPQVERAPQTSGLLQRFFARVDALGGNAGRMREAA
ncbi:MAG: alpha/beta fold hydrolase [Actinomycetota bacterium]|nr:alpha/beta fold hydrolase [Actinomycetota bacterium]